MRQFKSHHGFTLLELLVSITVLVLLIVAATAIVNSAATITTLGSKRMENASDVRPLFARMDTDFSQMLKRSDVTYYSKLSASNFEAGNDQIAFFSLVDGFYPGSTSTAEVDQPQTTLLSYRINGNYQLERMSKSLPFAGQAAPTPSLIFGNTSPHTLSLTWPTAVSTTASDSDYAVIAADVFRFEYFYIQKSDGAAVTTPSAWTATTINMSDVAAIGVCIAVIDPRSRKLLSASNADIAALSNAMQDYAAGMNTTGLLTQWQDALDASTLPRPAVNGIRLFQRIFPL